LEVSQELPDFDCCYSLSIISLFSYSDEYSDSDLYPVVFFVVALNLTFFLAFGILMLLYYVLNTQHRPIQFVELMFTVFTNIFVFADIYKIVESIQQVELLIMQLIAFIFL